jgi:hypothetical protein
MQKFLDYADFVRKLAIAMLSEMGSLHALLGKLLLRDKINFFRHWRYKYCIGKKLSFYQFC